MQFNPNQEKVIVLVTVFTVVFIQAESHTIKRETRCPPFRDAEWRARNGTCEPGKIYHCFEDEDGIVNGAGCFASKTCLNGSHPVIEHTGIVCSFCQKGFQAVNGLPSENYSYSYCESHSPACDINKGESLCQAATIYNDRRCTCNTTLGFSPPINRKDCKCFSENDPCGSCEFTGCPAGFSKYNKAYCEPERTTAHLSSTVFAHTTSIGTSPNTASDSSLPGRDIALIVVLPALFIMLFCAFYFVYRRRWANKKKPESQSFLCNGDASIPVNNEQDDSNIPLSQKITYNIESANFYLKDRNKLQIGRAESVNIARFTGDVLIGENEGEVPSSTNENSVMAGSQEESSIVIAEEELTVPSGEITGPTTIPHSDHSQPSAPPASMLDDEVDEEGKPFVAEDSSSQTEVKRPLHDAENNEEQTYRKIVFSADDKANGQTTGHQVSSHAETEPFLQDENAPEHTRNIIDIGSGDEAADLDLH